MVTATWMPIWFKEEDWEKPVILSWRTSSFGISEMAHSRQYAPIAVPVIEVTVWELPRPTTITMATSTSMSLM